MDRSSDKLFEYAREVNHYCELRPDSELAKIKIVPSYILVGDQSSGKTSLLSRLARMPLGYTANKTGTRRPVEYNLIHDPTKHEPEIEVNSKQVTLAEFLPVMIKENGTEGFNDRAVSVKILWKEIPESVIVADMPGMKDGDNAPENMILQRLKNSNVIPVVILEPKDFDSKHFAFDLLKRAGRSYSDIIAVVNKCDEKMAEKGQWSNQQDWTDFWETANRKGFKKICITGWPCSSSDRNSQDQEKQRRVLGESCEQENKLIQEWQRRVDVSPEARECVGLEKFRQMLHRDQSSRLSELCLKSLPQLLRENAQVQIQLQQLRTKSKESLKKMLSNIMHEWAHEASELLEGKVDVHDFTSPSSTADEDVQWLSSQGTALFDQLPNESLHRSSTLRLLKGSFFTIFEGDGLPDNASWINAVSYSIFAPDEKLLGKAAFERILDIVFTAALCRVFQHTLMEFNSPFISNILAENSQDSGNKVLQHFVKRVLTHTLHPMVDVMSLLIWKHLEICFTLAYKPWSRDCDGLKEVGLPSHFDASAKLYAHSLIKNLNEDLHERLDENGNLLQGRGRSGKSNAAIANNFSGNTFPEDGEDEKQYNDLTEPDFCSAASAFLQIGMDVLQKGSDKCRRNIQFYQILELAAMQLKQKENKQQDLDLKELFKSKSQMDAMGCKEVQKLRSKPVHMMPGKMIKVTLQIDDFEEEKSMKEATPDRANSGILGRAISCAPDRNRADERVTYRSIPEEMIDKRSDERVLTSQLKPEEMCCVVALNDFKDGKWFQCQIPAQIAKGQGDQELQFQADSKPEYLNKLATIDILCRNVKVTVKQVCISKAKSPETNADSGSEAGGVEENPGATEVMKIATNLVSHMSSNFKPLQGFAATGIRMDFRKLMVDLSCELVEQTVSFRELLEKRLHKLKLTAKKQLGHEMTTTEAADQVLGSICKGTKKQVRKLETYEKVLRKALDLHDQYANPNASDDPDSD